MFSPLKRIKRSAAASSIRHIREVPDIPSVDESHVHVDPAALQPLLTRRAEVPSEEALSEKDAQPRHDGPASETNARRTQQKQLIDVKHLQRSDTRTRISGKPAWLQGILEEWSNPVFRPLQKPIRCVQARTVPRLEHFHIQASALVPSQIHLEKEMLHWCKFIAQIDTKFLLFKTTEQSDTALILLDQHAADERIRVEGFLRQYCLQFHRDQVDKLHLGQEIAILLTELEVRQATLHSNWLSQWGFDISSQSPEFVESDSGFKQVAVKTLPSILADRLKVDDRLLQSVLRGMLSHAEEQGIVASTKREVSWITIMKQMPSILLDLVNSKACRGM